jgi:hypothetical protein
MKHSTGRLATVAVALFWFTTGAHADPSWSFSWERGPATIDADSPGTGGISLAPFAVGTKTGSQFIQGLTFTTFSSAATTAPDHFTNAAYFLTLNLTDLSSNATGSVTFNGQFNGDLTATTADLQHQYTSPLVQKITLGNYDYKVTIGANPQLSAPNSTLVTTLGAQVDVSLHPSGGETGGNLASTPEPSTLLLVGLAAPFLGVRWARRNRMMRR